MLTEKVLMCLIICITFICIATIIFLMTYIDNKYVYISRKEFEALCDEVDKLKSGKKINRG